MVFSWILAIIPALAYPSVCWAYWRVLSHKRFVIEQVLGPIAAKLLYKTLYVRASSSDADNGRDPVASLFEVTYDLPSYIVAILINGAFVFLAATVGLSKAGLPLGIPAELESAIARIPMAVVAGMSGAYLWGIYDILRRYWSTELSVVSLHSIWLRLLVAAALSAIVDINVKESASVLIAFGIGTFPLNAIAEFFRGHAKNHFQIGANSELGEAPTLHVLQGLTKDVIGRLRDEGIDSTARLAYADPIRLLLRTNFEWIAILDMIDQAALSIYVGDKIGDLRKAGLRGVIEAIVLWESIQSDPSGTIPAALLAQISGRLGQDDMATRNLLATIDHDAHFKFLRALWTGVYPA